MAHVGRSPNLLFALFDLLFSLLRWTFQPAPRDLALHAVCARFMRNDVADRRRNSPFVAFIARAKEHADFFGPGFSQAHHAVIAI